MKPYSELPQELRDLLTELEPDWLEVETCLQFAADQEMDLSMVISDLYFGKHATFLPPQTLREIDRLMGEGDFVSRHNG
jgi:hypothetical protein